MKVKDQKDFLKALEKKDEYLINECFDRILNNCVETIDDKPFDNDTVCIQDRSFLLLKIREQTTGPKAKISHICPISEEVVNDIEVDLSKFQVTKFQGQLSQVIDLTDNIKVTLGPVTRKIEKDIEKWLKEKSKDGSMVDRRYCAYAGVIKGVQLRNTETEVFETVEGLTFDNMLEFITESCTQTHLDKLDQYIKTLEFGVKPIFHFKSKVYENEQEEANLISFFIM